MEKSIYGDRLPEMEKTMSDILERITLFRKEMEQKNGMDPVEHCAYRIKSEESMREKCRRRNLPETTESALKEIRDAIGIRIVCAFLSDVYAVVKRLKTLDWIEVVTEKDYIKNVKPNGYRSYHMILKTENELFVEVQLRTISMDTWAALEHHMKYKKNVTVNTELIVAELRRCADELASTDVSMQAIRDLIFESSK